MDNITHSLVGWALGQAGLKAKSRKGMAALVLGANAPDIDVFTQWASWEPLATHRGFTHSLIGGGMILPLLLWGLLLALDKWQVARGTRFKSGLAMHPLWLLALCYIGAITHPLLDLQTSYSVQLFSPLSGAWWNATSLFIIDWVVWLTLILGIARSQGREANGDPEYGRPVQIAMLGVIAYVGFNLGVSDTARREVKSRFPKATSIIASPPAFRFWDRSLVWVEDGWIGQAKWTFRGHLGQAEPLIDPMMDKPAVRLAIATDPKIRKFLYWSIMPIADVRIDGCEAQVALGDARYLALGRRSRLGRETEVDVCA